MITRGIVLASKEAGTKVLVRLPLIHGMNGDALSPTDHQLMTSDLWASVLCTPGTVVNYEVGDIVLVAYEDYSSDKQLVLGHLASPIGKYVCAKLNMSGYEEKSSDGRHTVGEFPSYVAKEIVVDGKLSVNNIEVTSTDGLNIKGDIKVTQGVTNTTVDIVALQNKVATLEAELAALRSLMSGFSPTIPPTSTI